MSIKSNKFNHCMPKNPYANGKMHHRISQFNTRATRFMYRCLQLDKKFFIRFANKYIRSLEYHVQFADSPVRPRLKQSLIVFFL